MDELEDPAIDKTGAAELFRNRLSGSPLSVAPAKAVVKWYFIDPDSPSDACACIGSDIAHRLALPDVFGKIVTRTDARPYFVLVAMSEHVDDPRRPRFTDCRELLSLEVWRPGGATVPWIAGCKGLDEVVAPPLDFAKQVVALAFVMCHEP
ncbi:MAG: hypothetical protein AB7F36_01725 [Reyranellaceae bacterium]